MPPQLKEGAGVLQQQHLRKSYTPGDLLAKLQHIHDVYVCTCACACMCLRVCECVRVVVGGGGALHSPSGGIASECTQRKET
eukprot:366465-Chlamydomonas_euryale.AAC.8